MAECGWVIFLDIDGVLLPERQLLAPENNEARRLLMRGDLKGAALASVFDAGCVARLNKLAYEGRADIVVHSDWRAKVGLEDTVRHLVAQGVKKSLFHPEPCGWGAKRGPCKADDIWAWVGRLQPLSFVVLDDEPLISYGEKLPLVSIDGVVGLTDKDCERALSFLGCNEKRWGGQ